MISPRRVTFAYLGLGVLSVIWGMAFVAIKQADLELSPVNLALLRWFVASALFLVLLPVIGRPKVKIEGRDIPRFLVVALANVAGYHLALNYAETTVSAGLAAFLVSFGPVFVVVLSIVFLHEKAGRRVLVALVLAIVGAFALSYNSINPGDLTSFLGPGAAILSGFFYAVFGVLGKPLVNKYGSAPTTIMAGLMGTLMMLPLLSTGFVMQVASLSMNGWVSVLYLSVLSTTLGYLLFYGMVSRGAVSRLSIQLYIIPIVSVLGGILLLNESVTALMVVGGGMMLAGVAVASWR